MDIDKSIDKSIDKTIKFLINLIKINTQQGESSIDCPFGIGPKKALEITLDYCNKLGFDIKNIDNYIGYAEIGEGEELIGIPMHLDIVPPGEGWTINPFSGAIIEDSIYGRGAIDNKGAISMLIHVLKNIKDAYPLINKRIRLIFGTNEENGMECIKYYLIKGEEIPNIGFTPDAVYPIVNGEKGRIHIRIEKTFSLDKTKPYILLSGGIKENVVPSICNAKIIGNSIITLVTKGKSAHASTPEKGENAISKMLLKLKEWDINYQLKKEIKLLAQYLGTEFYGETLKINKKDNIFENTTINLGLLEINESKIRCEVDIRYGKNIKYIEVLNSFNKYFNEGWDVKMLTHKKLHYVDAENIVIKKLLAAYEEVTNKSGYTIAIGGGTYASYFENMVAFGPKFIEYRTGGHGVDENVPIVHIRENMKIYTLALLKLLDL